MSGLPKGSGFGIPKEDGFVFSFFFLLLLRGAYLTIEDQTRFGHKQ